MDAPRASNQRSRSSSGASSAAAARAFVFGPIYSRETVGGPFSACAPGGTDAGAEYKRPFKGQHGGQKRASSRRRNGRPLLRSGQTPVCPWSHMGREEAEVSCPYIPPHSPVTKRAPAFKERSLCCEVYRSRFSERTAALHTRNPADPRILQRQLSTIGCPEYSCDAPCWT